MIEQSLETLSFETMNIPLYLFILQGFLVSSGLSNVVDAYGSSRDLIIGGSKADATKYPFFALLTFDLGSFPSSSIPTSCGGTLINSDVVMTSARCLNDAESIDVWVNSTSRDYSEYEYFRTSKRIVTHPKYVQYSSGNDISLIFLDSPVKNVPVVQINRDSAVPGDKRTLVTAIGFGRTIASSYYYDGGYPRCCIL
jgi:secreted trypsin-like serine protease